MATARCNVGHHPGNLTTDAHIAALAIEHGYTVYSSDADFGRFQNLSWINPLN
jgi:predicted nucleic acid-binding protein